MIAFKSKKPSQIGMKKIYAPKILIGRLISAIFNRQPVYFGYWIYIICNKPQHDFHAVQVHNLLQNIFPVLGAIFHIAQFHLYITFQFERFIINKIKHILQCCMICNPTVIIFKFPISQPFLPWALIDHPSLQ